MYFLLKMWAFVLVGFCPRGLCPRGFCPTLISHSNGHFPGCRTFVD